MLEKCRFSGVAASAFVRHIPACRFPADFGAAFVICSALQQHIFAAFECFNVVKCTFLNYCAYAKKPYKYTTFCFSCVLRASRGLVAQRVFAFRAVKCRITIWKIFENSAKRSTPVNRKKCSVFELCSNISANSARLPHIAAF